MKWCTSQRGALFKPTFYYSDDHQTKEQFVMVAPFKPLQTVQL